MVKKYKVISSVGEDKEYMQDVEFRIDIEDDSIGAEINCLGDSFRITQNGKILVLVNEDWVLTIMEQYQPEEKQNLRTDLVPNIDYDIFLETKTFKLYDTNLMKRGVSYKKFYDTIKDEWSNVEKLSEEPFPLKFNDEYNSLVFINGWGWEDTCYTLLKEGSWGSEDKDGRSI